MASAVTPLQLGLAARLDKEGFKILEAQFQQEEGHCTVYSESNERCRELMQSAGRLDDDGEARFFAEFANEYLPNLMRVYSILNSGHHCTSVYNTMVEYIAHLPQFSRWIRESKEGPNFVYTLIQLMDRLPITESSGQGWIPEKDLAIQCRVFDRMTMILYWGLCCSPPDLTLSFATPVIQQKAARLSDRLALLCETTLFVLERYPKAAEEHRLSDKIEFFVERMVPFLLGQDKAGSVSACNTMEFWDCSGRGSGTPCVEVKERKDMLRCTRCTSVIYCSKAHQKRDWKNGHKLVCLPPTW